LETILFFGAGASFGSDLNTGAHTPPLGNGDNGLFAKLTRLNGIAHEISQAQPELADTFISNFETGMREYYDLKHGNISRFLKEMSLYFLGFNLTPHNIYPILLNRVRNCISKITFVTTNYDCLIEQAAETCHIPLRYSLHRDRQATLNFLKIHGSPNFIPQLGTNVFKNINCYTNMDGGAQLQAPCRPATKQETLDFLKIQDFAPAIAMYEPSKKVITSPDFVENQKELWKQCLKNSKLLIFVGLRVHEIDDHIWGEAARNAPDKVCYVGGEKKQFENWAKISKIKKYKCLGSTFTGALSGIFTELSA